MALDPIGGIIAEISADATVDAGLMKARNAMQALEAEAHKLESDFQKGAIAADNYNSRMSQLAVQETRLAASMKDGFARSTSGAADLAMGMNKLGGGMTTFAGKAMVVSQFMDDMQYGFRAVVNQIPMAVAAFGGSMGLAAGIGIAGVALNVFMNNWEKMASALGSPVVKSMADQMEELGKKTNKTSIEIEKLNRYTREQKTITEQGQRRPALEQETAKQVAEGVGEAGADTLKLEIKRKLAATLPPISDAELEKEMGGGHGGMAAFGGHTGTDVEGKRNAAMARIQKRREAQLASEAERLLSNAETGPGKEGDEARRRLANMLPGEMGDIFRRATPEGRIATSRSKAISEDLFAQSEMDAYDAEFGEWDKAGRELDQQKKDAEAASRQGPSLETQAVWQAQKDKEEHNEERNKAWFESKDEAWNLNLRGKDLNSRLQNILQGGRNGTGQSMDLQSYEAGIKADSGQKQLKKLEDIHKTLEEIRKNETDKSINAKRIPR